MADQLIHGHREFRAQYFDERHLLERLATQGQSPRALLIGCCDSRVVPEILTQSGLGDIFVVRNIANFVPDFDHADASVGAAIEYAVEHLEVQDVIVCGHTGCGGVKAALDGADKLSEHPALMKWIEGIEPSANRARNLKLEGDQLWRYAVEENVIDSVANLITWEPIRSRLERNVLHIHAWLYEMKEGKLLAFDPETDVFADVISGKSPAAR
jgi:carbonic anhydrase